jgi:hypothetical protein
VERASHLLTSRSIGCVGEVGPHVGSCRHGCDVAAVVSDKRNVVAPELVIEAARAGEAVDCGDRDGRGTAAVDLLRTLCRERREGSGRRAPSTPVRTGR